MTKKDEEEFLNIVNTTSTEEKGKGENNLYNILGLTPFSVYDKDNYDVRKEYIARELKDKPDDLDKARKLINMANPILSHPKKKNKYDIELKLILEKRLIKFIKFAVSKDKILDTGEREQIEETGESFGFSTSEINNIIEEQRKKDNFIDSSSSKQNEASSTTTKAGSPKLEIHNNTNFTKNSKFIFDNVKLTETRREVITIKNGGGGTLDAKAVFSAKWIEVTPKDIHQSKLSQDVTIIVDPSKDKSLKSGSKIMDTINLTYASSGGTIRTPIVVEMIIEGHHDLVKRQVKYATIVSSILAGLTLLYIFSNYDFYGWVIFGFVISAILIARAAFAVIENEKAGLEEVCLFIGGIILLITDWTIFALLLAVIITFYTAKSIFEKNPFRNELIAIIPIVFFALSLVPFNLRYSNYNYNNYNTNKSTQPTYNPVTSINKTGYISAKVYANIRSGTSTDYGILSSINRGETIYIIEQDKASNWYKVKYNNNYGYISNKLISFDYISKNKERKTNKNSKNITKKNNNTNSTTKVRGTTQTTSKRLNKSFFAGNWVIDRGNSKYRFRLNGSGYYQNSRGKTFYFKWSINNNYLKIILNSDNSVWNWKINSFTSNKVNMYSSKHNTNRIITKH